MTIRPNGRLGKHRVWYAAEQENVLLPKGANRITSGIPAYKRARVTKVAEKLDSKPSGHGWMLETYFAWVFNGEPTTERCQPTR